MAAKPDVWMPVYIGDYLGDTGHLSTEQHGAYMLMMMHYWRTGGLPAAEAEQAQVVKLSVSKWRRHRPTIACFFREEDGQWRHKRIDLELAKAATHAERRSAKASKAAAARWSDDAPSNAIRNATSMPQAMLVECPLPSPSPSPDNTQSDLSSEHSSAAWRFAASSHERYAEVSQRVSDILANPNLLVFGRVDVWLKSGADPEADIYPTLERMKASWKGSNLKYFEGAIADALAARTEPLAPGAANSNASRFSPTDIIRNLPKDA